MKSLNSLGVLIFFTICSIEARKFFPVCPDCEIRFKESFRGFAMRYINGNVPSNAPCLSGGKIIFLGKDYGVINDGCCCLHSPAAPPIVCGPDSPQCPAAVIVGTDETAEHYFKRIGRNLKGAPSNGCCPPGTFKFIFEQELADTSDDLCACFSLSKMADPNFNWSDS